MQMKMLSHTWYIKTCISDLTNICICPHIL